MLRLPPPIKSIRLIGHSGLSLLLKRILEKLIPVIVMKTHLKLPLRVKNLNVLVLNYVSIVAWYKYRLKNLKSKYIPLVVQLEIGIMKIILSVACSYIESFNQKRYVFYCRSPLGLMPTVPNCHLLLPCN